jgi:hypothetical protein
MRPMFEVVEAERTPQGYWIVQGRAWEDINLNDCLVVIHGSESTQFTTLDVIGISTYGRELEQLARVMTGSLTLTSTTEIEITQGDMLYEVS